jgi:inosine-uridine nucleoside N-ribohydrolase
VQTTGKDTPILHSRKIAIGFCFLIALATLVAASPAQSAATHEKIIVDTDIGDDIDDAFALALALRSPELEILGITTTFGDTETRARIVDRMLGESEHENIPVAAGAPTKTDSILTQRRYADGGHFARRSHPAAVDFILDQIRRHPGEITLVAIGPLMNLGAAIDKDPATFHQLKRVVLMGGSVYRGYGDVGYFPPHGPDDEWNIENDIPSARKLFAAGVPLYVMPLDSTQIKLDEVNRSMLFHSGTPLTDALTLLYHQWGELTPTLFDVMTIAYMLDSRICPVQPMRLRVDDKGFTRPEPGPPNVQVCLDSNSDDFFRLYMSRVAVP